MRHSLVNGSKLLLSFTDYITYPEEFALKVKNGFGVRIEYDCVGYGVMSFWLAFIVANKGSWQKKMAWIFGGWLMIWIINVIRISLVLVAANKHWQFPFGWDHHTWFTIAAYILIFIMIFFYDRSVRSKRIHQHEIIVPDSSNQPQNLVNGNTGY